MDTSRDVSRFTYVLMILFIFAVAFYYLSGPSRTILSLWSGGISNDVPRVNATVDIEEQFQPEHQIVFSLRDLQFIKRDGYGSACIHNIKIQLKVNNSAELPRLFNLDKPFCESDVIPFSQLNNSSIKLDYPVSNLMQYPYDDISISDLISVNDSEGSKVILWSTSYTVEAPNRFTSESGNVLTMKRSILHRYLLPVFLFSIFIVILALPKVADLGAFAQVAVAVLFGIWGARQIIVPFDIKEPIYLDNILLFFYFLLFIPIIVKVLSVIFSGSTDVQNNQTFDDSDIFLDELLASRQTYPRRPIPRRGILDDDIDSPVHNRPITRRRRL